MSRRVIGVLTCLLVAGVLCGAVRASAPPATSPPAAKPIMLVGPLAPLTVRGVRFKPRERVTLTLDGGKRGVKHVLADRLGSFSARFEIRLAPCRTVTIRAVGSRGSRAVRQVPRPNCREP